MTFPMELVAEVVFWWIYDVKDPKESNYYLFEKETDKNFWFKTFRHHLSPFGKKSNNVLYSFALCLYSFLDNARASF